MKKELSKVSHLAIVAAMLCAPFGQALADAKAKDPIAFVSLRNGDAHIFIADGAGHDQALTHGKSVNTQPAWAADGTRLAFTSNREGLTKIYLMDVDGSNLRRLSTDTRIESAPSWAPDGSAVAYYSRSLDGADVGLRITEIASGKTVTIRGNGLDKGPEAAVWSNDSARLAFSGANEHGKTEIWIANRDGTEQREISSKVSTRHKGHASISPDGKQVVYVADMRGSVAIVATDLESGKSTILTEGIEAAHENPRWSPDGKQIAFASSRDDPQGTRLDIFVMNADGSGARNLSRDPHEDFNPQWSADGSHVVFNSLRTGTAQLFSFFFESGTTERITNNGSHDMEQSPRPLALH